MSENPVPGEDPVSGFWIAVFLLWPHGGEQRRGGWERRGGEEREHSL